MRTQVHIIGGGPAGLFFAIQACKAGMDVTVYDKRIGQYTRPGTVNLPTMIKIYNAIDPTFSFVDSKGRFFNRALHLSKKTKTLPHIKDAERLLYHYVNYLNEEKGVIPIKFEHKNFVRISDDGKSFVIADSDNSEALIQCDESSILVDCTGSARIVINQVNQKNSLAFPFASNPLPPHEHHFIAYVKLKADDFAKFKQYIFNNRVEIQDILYMFESMQTMKADFQWESFNFPKLYAALSNKQKFKVCLYGECASGNLTIDALKSWAAFLLSAYTGGKITGFEEITRAESKIKKPRMGLFTTGNKYLTKSFYQFPGGTAVLAAGDTQVDPYFAKGVGIEGMINRVNIFFDCAKIKNGCLDLTVFDEKKFTEETAAEILKLIRYFKNEEDQAKFYEAHLSYIDKLTDELIKELNTAKRENKEALLTRAPKLKEKIRAVVAVSKLIDHPAHEALKESLISLDKIINSIENHDSNSPKTSSALFSQEPFDIKTEIETLLSHLEKAKSLIEDRSPDAKSTLTQ